MGIDWPKVRSEEAERQARREQEAEACRRSVRGGDFCARCHRTIAATEPVYRRCWGGRAAVFCEACCPRGRWLGEATRQETCTGCGRCFYISAAALHVRACCHRCKNREKVKKRSQQRAQRRQAIACTICGQRFQPRRADALTCSSACRQKRYRQG
jgi:hypothetical protein